MLFKVLRIFDNLSRIKDLKIILMSKISHFTIRRLLSFNLYEKF